MSNLDLTSVVVKLPQGDLEFITVLTKDTPGKVVGDHIRAAVKEYIDKKRRG